MFVRAFVRLSCVALALLCSAAFRSAHAQAGRIAGGVVDATSGQPVEGVQVVVQGTGYGAITKANGRFVIINLPPGVYTVVARRIGYQEQQTRGVSVLIDVTREVDFRLSPATAALATVRITEARTPLIQPGITGSADAITAADLVSLPVTDIRGALSLQAGFFAAPENTDITSYTDQRRALLPVHIRGGRPTETVTLIDNIPVNNFLFGGPALDISTDAVQQIDYVRGGFEPQYGNALSGIINIAVKEGTPGLRGAVEGRSSGVGGTLGSRYDDLRNYRQVQGFVSGALPVYGDRIRFLFSGRQREGASRVLEFDNQVYNPRADIRDQNQNFQSNLDLFPGFRAFGYDTQRDVIAKTSVYFTPLTKANFTFIDYARTSLPFDFDWEQTGFNAYAQCVKLYPDLPETCRSVYNGGRDVTTLADLQDTNNENWYVRQASTRQLRQLYVGQFNQTRGRLALSASAGQFNQHRNTCTFASGVCQGTRIAYTYINGPFVYSGGRSRNTGVPLFGTEELTGSDQIRTQVARGDVVWQASDHHNIQGGLFGQRHEVEFQEWRDIGLNRSVLDLSRFKAKPWDAAAYLQDRIEYDFLTIKVGARFDYGRAPGQFFADPRDPTNRTTAREVCEGTAPSLGATTPYTYTDTLRGSATFGQTFTGVAACSLNETLKREARDIALQDDFRDGITRKQFSPRIGLQFPLTQQASLFFNFGRFAQNPALFDLYRGTGIGNPEEGTPAAVRVIPQSGSPAPLLGNPQLQTETSTSYEIGYAQEFLQNYSIRVTAYNKDQSGLSGLRRGGLRPDGSVAQDFGETYNAQTFQYNILVNSDYQVSRGIEAQFRRRLVNFTSFDLNYAFSRVVTNADPPDLEAQKRAEGDPPVTRLRSSVDQPHVFNGTLRFQTDARTPHLMGVGRYLRYAAVTATVRAASGLPYTPIQGINGTAQDRNSGTSPATFSMDMYGSKDWVLSNVRVGAFVTVSNLLNRRNCVQVYTTTGQCESGGFTPGRLEKGRIGAGIGATGTFSQAYDRPDYYYAPRSVSGGLRVTF